MKKKNKQDKKKDNRLNKKKKSTTKSKVLKLSLKKESDIVDSRIERILDKKLNAKKKKNDKLFLENQFKLDRSLNEAALKKVIRNFTF